MKENGGDTQAEHRRRRILHEPRRI